MPFVADTTATTNTRIHSAHRRRALALAIHLACAGAVLLPLAGVHSAQAQNAAASQRIAFDIPAGSLTDTLNRFAEKSGVYLSGAGVLTQNKTSSGLQGNYTISEGLQTLLAGSGVTFRFSADNTVTLIKATDGAAVLPTMKINASAPDAAITEHSGSYATPVTSNATRLTLTPRQTPQTITVITRQLIDDTAAENVTDVLNLVPGIVVGTGDSDRNTYTARGYSLQVQYDGTPFGGGLSGEVIPVPDAAVIDRTEVLLGASGLLNGVGQPGGSVNIVWKRPTAESQVLANASVGSWNARRLWVDASGSVIESKRLRARAVALNQSEDSFRDIETGKKSLFYTVIEGDLTDSTVVSARFQFQDFYDNVADRSGLPPGNDGQDLHWDRDSFLAPAWNRWDKSSKTYWLTLEQRLPADWKLKAQISRVKSEDERLFGVVDTFDSDTGEAEFGRWGAQTEDVTDSAEVFASGGFAAFGREHELVVGSNWSRWRWSTLDGAATPATANLYGFDPHTSVPQPEVIWSSEWLGLNQTQYGLYSALRLSWTDSLKTIVGARVSWYEYSYAPYPQGDLDADGEVTPYAGVIYDINSWASAYVSYADIFIPQSLRNPSGSTLDPEVGANYEAGVKTEFFDKRLNASAAIFRVEKQNEAQQIDSIPYDESNICGGYCYEAKGETVTDGVDLNIAGEVGRGWQLLGGYTQYHKEEYDLARVFKLSSTYTRPGGLWSAGATVDSASTTVGQWGSIQQARTLLNLFGSYRLNDQISLALNVDNVFDEEYYANDLRSGYNNVFFGEARRWTLSLRGEF